MADKKELSDTYHSSEGVEEGDSSSQIDDFERRLAGVQGNPRYGSNAGNAKIQRPHAQVKPSSNASSAASGSKSEKSARPAANNAASKSKSHSNSASAEDEDALGDSTADVDAVRNLPKY
jgi:hypothetical protein